MYKFKFALFFCLIFFPFYNSVFGSELLLQVSKDFLYSLKNDQSTDDCKFILENTSVEELEYQLNDDNKRKAFWINIYNAFIMDILKENPSLYLDKGNFFKSKQINIGGKLISFDDIEHGIIRRSISKYSFGYIRKIFIPHFERKLRLENRDERVHFALNCGAQSCPPVAIFDARKMDNQLDKASELFLKSTSDYDRSSNVVYVTPIISWFRGDFGGLSGAKRLLKKYGVVEKVDISLEFTTYDWNLYLFNFIDL